MAKKYASLKTGFAELLESLEEQPNQGKALGNNCYKFVYLLILKEKSGGARIITNIIISEKVVYLLSIYDKSEKKILQIRN